MIILLSLISLLQSPPHSSPLLPSPPQLASTLLSQLDPMADSTPPPPSDLLPSYTHPKMVFTTLPGISLSPSFSLPSSFFPLSPSFPSHCMGGYILRVLSLSSSSSPLSLSPGGLYYLHVEKPNCGESLQTLMEQPSYVRPQSLALFQTCTHK